VANILERIVGAQQRVDKAADPIAIAADEHFERRLGARLGVAHQRRNHFLFETDAAGDDETWRSVSKLRSDRSRFRDMVEEFGARLCHPA
jgi:hypothetical protein